ncbi:MAG: hypothetical protein JJE03_04560 [Peptostreptococcaceae bacterium]|nr:hypothetical protein [Peptostreptococcaceae bacterium]
MNRIYLKDENETKLMSFGRKEKIRIGVIGIGKCVGASTIALLLASKLADMGIGTAYVELGIPNSMRSLTYDKLAMGIRFSKSEFNDFYENLYKGMSIRRMKNLSSGINWALITPKDIKEEINLTAENKLRLIANIFGEIVIVDMSVGEIDLINEMDYIIPVIDPMPSVLLANEKSLNYIYEKGLREDNVIWVINKFNGGIIKSQLNSFIKLKKYIKIPCLPCEEIYKMEYSCKILSKSKTINKLTNDEINRIILTMGIKNKHNK